MSVLTVEALSAAGLLAPLDIHLVRTLARLSGGDMSPLAAVGVALASRAVRSGHVCVDLVGLGGTAVLSEDGSVVDGLVHPPGAAWRDAVAGSAVAGPPDAGLPLVLDASGRLYLRRFWAWQSALADALSVRAQAPVDAVDGPLLRAGLDRLFAGGPPTESEVDWQRTAAQLAVLRRFCVVSGGPGTGKTSTVVKMLALLMEQALHAGRTPPVVMLLAPTGKAAARLTESIRSATAGLDVRDDVRMLIPDEAQTIHRALGVVGGATARFRRDRERPLAADLVLVDEASMVDLALMTRLEAAVPPRARLVLLGDKDQLASVDAGSVLGDVCNAGRPWRHSRALAASLRAASGDAIPVGPDSPDGPAFGDAIVHLRHSYRFGATSGIAALASAINAGAAAEALSVLADPVRTDVCLADPIPTAGLGAVLRDRILETFRAVVEARDPTSKLKAFDAFRVLAVHRKGTTGVDGLNRSIEQALLRAGLLEAGGEWYAHRPLMVTENDYQLGLFNGDVGMVLDEPGEARAAVFVTSAGMVRRVPPTRLPPHQTVFAMTVHKSQGSEFEEVALVLPSRPSPVMTRELVYTAVTRARQVARIFGDPAVLETAIRAQTTRASGLRDALWGAD
ncbi:MAG: exodeoxyribonuclease V subunit alpha [Myxococcota bacterium]|nr:exodeoxyribonuclease V subunit alpha [Myxococcota bacterium]MEC8424208.1 exodeoxyribonuclease V subunit alpha [Myxococcota bacterium]